LSFPFEILSGGINDVPTAASAVCRERLCRTPKREARRD
jgi:hypothetical protein